MSPVTPWRQRLLGSLQGQLQLATYLMVFIGFTGASSVGLWIGQRNLIEQEISVLRRSAEYCQQAIADQSDDALLGDVLDDHSSHRTTLWLEQPDGALIIPQSDYIPRSNEAMQASMRANQGKVVGQQLLIDSAETQYLSELVEQYPSGARLWIKHEVGSNQEALSDYLGLMILIWGACLTVTLLSVSWFVERIIRPLDQLSAATDQVTADTLNSARLHLDDGPSEVIQLSRTYNALLERLAQSWGQQRQFVSAVSHELRTPLTIVQGYLHRTIKRANNLSADQVKGLQTAEEESIRMRRLMDDLLDLSRSDSGKLALCREEVQLVDQIEQAADLAHHTLKRPLRVELPDDPAGRDALVLADPARLRQVLLDLIENADKYSPEDTPIRLVLRHTTSAALIDVIDQGIGIPEAELDTVFERFQRGSNAPKKTGSGLGLSVVKLLVEGMGGSIEVHSRLGEGSCFTVILPS